MYVGIPMHAGMLDLGNRNWEFTDDEARSGANMVDLFRSS